MRGKMLVEISLLCEALSANMSTMRPYSSVHSAVVKEVPTPLELPVALALVFANINVGGPARSTGLLFFDDVLVSSQLI